MFSVREGRGPAERRASPHWPGNGCTDPYQFVTSLTNMVSYPPGLLSSDFLSISMENDWPGSLKIAVVRVAVLDRRVISRW